MLRVGEIRTGRFIADDKGEFLLLLQSSMKGRFGMGEEGAQ